MSNFEDIVARIGKYEKTGNEDLLKGIENKILALDRIYTTELMDKINVLIKYNESEKNFSNESRKQEISAIIPKLKELSELCNKHADEVTEDFNGGESKKEEEKPLIPMEKIRGASSEAILEMIAKMQAELKSREPKEGEVQGDE